MADRIVLNIPHSSFQFPFGYDAWDNGIHIDMERLTDIFTDKLFIPDTSQPEIIPVIFPYSRFFCDAERLVDDPMEKIGQGIIYRRFNGKSRMVSVADEERIMEFYWNYQRCLCEAIRDENSFVVDCHSFPSDISDVDICIGLNDDWSRPDDKLVDDIITVFNRYGYTTAINTPFSNSITPECSFRYKSLMIEVNKKRYLSDDNLIDESKMIRIKSAILDVYSAIFAYKSM